MRAPLLLALLPLLAVSPAHADEECMPMEALLCMPEDALAYSLAPAPRVDGYGGYPFSIAGQQGGPNQAGGKLIIAGGPAGPGDLAGKGGDLFLVGGAPNATGQGGDVRLECHPDAVIECGLDVGFHPRVKAILIGHPPANASDDTGRVAFLGRIKTNVYWQSDYAGTLTADPPGTAGGNGVAVTLSGAPAAPGDATHTGGIGGPGVCRGGAGGDGTATTAAGRGGDATLVAWAAGADGGGGGAAGGSANVKVGAGSGGWGNGALNLASQGPAPSSINVGQPGVPIKLLGYVPEERTASVVTADFTSQWPAGADVVVERGPWGAARALYLPAPSTLGVPAGKTRHLAVKVDGGITGRTLYIYPGGGSTLDGSTAAQTVVDAWASRHFFTDGAAWYSE